MSSPLFRYILTVILLSFVFLLFKCFFAFYWFLSSYLPNIGSDFKRYYKQNKRFHQNYLAFSKSQKTYNPEITSFFKNNEEEVATIYLDFKTICYEYLVSGIISAFFYGAVLCFPFEKIKALLEIFIPLSLREYAPPNAIYISLVAILPLIFGYFDWKDRFRSRFTKILEKRLRIINEYRLISDYHDCSVQSNSKEKLKRGEYVELLLYRISFLIGWLGVVFYLIANVYIIRDFIKQPFFYFGANLKYIFFYTFPHIFTPLMRLAISCIIASIFLGNLSDFLFYAQADAERGDLIGRLRERAAFKPKVNGSGIPDEVIDEWKNNYLNKFIQMKNLLHISGVDIYLFEEKGDSIPIAGTFLQPLGRPAVFINLKKMSEYRIYEEYDQIMCLLLGHELAHISAKDYHGFRKKKYCFLFLCICVLLLCLLSFLSRLTLPRLMEWMIGGVLLVSFLLFDHFIANPLINKRCWGQIIEFRADRIGCIISDSGFRAFDLIKDFTDSNISGIENKKTYRGFPAFIMNKQEPEIDAHPQIESRKRELKKYFRKKWTILDDFRYCVQYAKQVHHNGDWRL